MAGKKRQFHCHVVDEMVMIHLRNRRVGGFDGGEEPFVQCDQLDCQYVDENAPPCPLTVELFADELREREERARQRRENADDGY